MDILLPFLLAKTFLIQRKKKQNSLLCPAKDPSGYVNVDCKPEDRWTRVSLKCPFTDADVKTQCNALPPPCNDLRCHADHIYTLQYFEGDKPGSTGYFKILQGEAMPLNLKYATLYFPFQFYTNAVYSNSKPEMILGGTIILGNVKVDQSTPENIVTIENLQDYPRKRNLSYIFGDTMIYSSVVISFGEKDYNFN